MQKNLEELTKNEKSLISFLKENVPSFLLATIGGLIGACPFYFSGENFSRKELFLTTAVGVLGGYCIGVFCKNTNYYKTQENYNQREM